MTVRDRVVELLTEALGPVQDPAWRRMAGELILDGCSQAELMCTIHELTFVAGLFALHAVDPDCELDYDAARSAALALVEQCRSNPSERTPS